MPPRCFLALTLPGGVVRTLLSARERFLADAPAWAGEKWVAATALHITVTFLGDLDDDPIATARRRLLEAASAVPAFDLSLTGVVAVPSPLAATMLWATLDDPGGRLLALRDALMTAFPQVAIDSRRPLRPHVTLARTRSRRRADAEPIATTSALIEAAGKGPDGVVSVRSATLFSSTVRPAGPEYREIAVVRLAR